MLMDGHISEDAHGRWVDVGWTLDGRWVDVGGALSLVSRTLEKIGQATVTQWSRSSFRIIRNTVI